MGGEGPYIDFDPDNVGKWSAHTGIKPLSQYELEAMWVRAAPLLQEIVVNPLVKDYGWSVIDGHAYISDELSTGDTRVNMVHSWKKKAGSCPSVLRGVQGITLQGDITKNSIASFLDRNQTTLWTKQFGYFDAKRINRNSDTMYIDSIPPLSNYIYLIQCLVPGIITLVRMDEIDDYGEITDGSWIS
ncbi:hypothetical protein BT96DRAFT_996483 [Gymnopus androsaceus JB14]|uniref:Uncharacterized protein n=1 Tax=Gymnopus androsaceus JB14 TaxID=1447944 RepID=A0A6A4HGH0_9AGAR|nr:hypothetical protein BT96DRAFT_996483 [Gymnopus androsaceus JB14]